MKFRKKPVVIDAMRFDDTLTAGNLADFLGEKAHSDGLVSWGRDDPSAAITIHTLEGDMKCQFGDWIIKGVKGEFYPCKPDIFAATYEPAE